MDPVAKKRLTIAIVLFVLAVIIVIAFALFKHLSRSSSSDKQPNVTTYVDEYSGETVTKTDGKVDEKAGSDSIIFLGSSKLLTYGVTANQIQRIKTALTQYSTKREQEGRPKITQVSVDMKTYTQSTDEKSGDFVNAFDIVINNDASQRYYMQLRSATVSDYTILIYNESRSVVVFDTNKAPADGL